MMKRRNVSVSAGAILLFAILYFFDDSGLIIALLPAVIIHELGHALMILALGGRLRGMRLDLSGLRMDFRGDTGTAGELAIAAAGPALGLLYAVTASALGARLGSGFLTCSAGISAVLTGLLTGVGLLLGGLWCMGRGYGMALLPAGFWILLLWAGGSCKKGGFGIQ